MAKDTDTGTTTDDVKDEDTVQGKDQSATDEGSKKTGRRTIGGNLAYNSTPGGLERTLNGIITAQKPPKVDTKYIQTTLSVKGGTGANQIKTLKKLGIVDNNGAPTEIYDQFRNDQLRSHAAFKMLENGYAAIFKVNAHSHKASEDEVKNIIAQVSGLDKDEPLISTIYSCFDKVRSFIDPNINVYEAPSGQPKDIVAEVDPSEPERTKNAVSVGRNTGTLGLTYQINIVLPQSGNIETYNLIFKALRDNLLDWDN